MIEIITIFLSGGALIVSLMSLYFSIWHKKTSLVASLVSVGSYIDVDESKDRFEFALSNTGNQELLLKDVHVYPVDLKEKELVPVPEVEGLPEIIMPKAVKLLSVPISKRFITSLAEKNRNIKIDFDFVIPNAEVKSASKIIYSNLELDTKKESWEPFKL